MDVSRGRTDGFRLLDVYQIKPRDVCHCVLTEPSTGRETQHHQAGRQDRLAGQGGVGGRFRLLAGGERGGAGLGADVDQTLAGLEAGQRLGAGQGGQRAAQAQHGRGVFFSCTHRGRVRTHGDAASFILHTAHSGGGGGRGPRAGVNRAFVRRHMCRGGPVPKAFRDK